MEEEIPLFLIDNDFYRQCGDRFIKICNYKDCTNLQRNANGFCFKHKLGINFKEPEPYKEILLIHENQTLRDKCRSTNLNGDKVENFIFELLKDNKDIEYVERIGQTFDRSDIKYKLNYQEEWRCLQVKMFSKCEKFEDKWTSSVQRKYDKNMLMVFSNQENNRFALLFFKDCPETNLTVTFPIPGKNKDNTFIDLNSFTTKLFSMIPESTLYQQTLSKNHTTEYHHFLRLKNQCKNHNITFELNDTSGSVVDCFINKYKIQCKASNTKCKKAIKYNFPLHKSSHGVKGKQFSMPYHEDDDIDFFIFEIVIYPGNFYIIPKHVLLQKGFIRTSSQCGKQIITMPPPDYKKKNWKMQYLNKFELLNQIAQ